MSARLASVRTAAKARWNSPPAQQRWKPLGFSGAWGEPDQWAPIRSARKALCLRVRQTNESKTVKLIVGVRIRPPPLTARPVTPPAPRV